MGLPRDLAGAGAALGTDVQKDKAGTALIRHFCIPRRDGGFNEPADHPEKFAAFVRYCQQDVETEQAIARRIVRLSDYEQAVYHLSERINDRGIRIDRTSALAALALAEKAKANLDAEMAQLTSGAVRRCTEVAKLTSWVQAQGVEMGSAARAEIAALLECDDLNPAVRRALELRQEAAKTSVSKLQSMLDRAGDDGRIRGSFLYHGAGTGRWTSMGVNFANLPRPRKVYEKAVEEGMSIRGLFDAFRTGEPAALQMLYGPELGRPLHLISDAIRGFLWAAPGHDFVQADYSSIEGNVIAWSSGEQWKVEALRAIQADPSLPDMYRRTAAQILGLTTNEVTKKHWARQAVGKVSELACFAAGTKVLTDRGILAIEEVSVDDRLWDGKTWVIHAGVVQRSARPVVVVDGIAVTPDHLIRTGPTWTPACGLVSDRNTLNLALETGSESLQSLMSHAAHQAARAGSMLGALAVANRILSTSTISAKARPPGAIRAPRGKVARRASRTWLTTTSFLTTLTDAVYSIASRLASTVARTLTTPAIQTTAVEASVCSGDGIDEPFSPISSRLTGGMFQHSNSTASTSIEDMSRGTSASSLAPSTQGTGGRRASCNAASSNSRSSSPESVPVYDIMMAGPRNQYTIFSDSGALVVHNCGFGGGVGAFYTMSKTYGVELRPLFEKVWESADDERREKAEKRYASCLKRKKEHAGELTREEWLACELIKTGWRAANSAIAAGWKLREEAVREAIRAPGTIQTALKFSYVVKLGFLWARLPSGRCLAYGAPKLTDQVWAKTIEPDLSWSEDEESFDRENAEQLERLGRVKITRKAPPRISALGVDSTTRKWSRYHLYGGLLAENDTQAIARDLLVNGMLKAEAAGYPIVAHVYDEMIAEVPAGFGDLKDFERIICELPAWADGIPLSASGWRGKRYRKD